MLRRTSARNTVVALVQVHQLLSALIQPLRDPVEPPMRLGNRQKQFSFLFTDCHVERCLVLVVAVTRAVSFAWRISLNFILLFVVISFFGPRRKSSIKLRSQCFAYGIFHVKILPTRSSFPIARFSHPTRLAAIASSTANLPSVSSSRRAREHLDEWTQFTRIFFQDSFGHQLERFVIRRKENILPEKLNQSTSMQLHLEFRGQFEEISPYQPHLPLAAADPVVATGSTCHC